MIYQHCHCFLISRDYFSWYWSWYNFLFFPKTKPYLCWYFQDLSYHLHRKCLMTVKGLHSMIKCLTMLGVWHAGYCGCFFSLSIKKYINLGVHNWDLSLLWIFWEFVVIILKWVFKEEFILHVILALSQFYNFVF